MQHQEGILAGHWTSLGFHSIIQKVGGWTSSPVLACRVTQDRLHFLKTDSWAYATDSDLAGLG